MAYEEAFKADFPYDLIYQSSRKEASRKKPVFFIHKYFARRITSNFRISLLSFLSNENDDLYKMFYEPSPQYNDITVLDPFMGGGTTIFEALRFGCKVIGNDLQPLSLFVTKALVASVDEIAVKKEVERLNNSVGEKIKKFYQTTCPCCGKNADSMYAFHVKKAETNSSCGTHKFYSSFVIAYKKNEFTIVCPQCGGLHKTKFEEGFFQCDCGWVLQSPKESYMKKGVFECHECHERISLTDCDEKTGYPFSTDIIAIEYYCPSCGMHDYKAPDQKDKILYDEACKYFKEIECELPIPTQMIPTGYNTNQIINHGYKNFKDLFNQRQLLCLGLLLQEINRIENKDTQLWLQLAFSGMLEMNNMFCRYQQNAYKITNIFFNHAYVPITMPVENCVWGTKLGTGTFLKTVDKILRGKKFNTGIYDLSVAQSDNGRYDSIKMPSDDSVKVTPVEDYSELDGKHPVLTCSDSRNLSHVPDESVDLVLTDPPYGANIMYSELIDFFHVWNYQSSIANQIGFTEPLSQKKNEIIVNSIAGKDFQYYQDGITSVLTECYKKLKSCGYLVFTFHDKSLESWLAVLKSIHSAGFKLEKSYPVQAETRTGAHTSNKNSIGIDIILISKKTSSNIAVMQEDSKLTKEEAFAQTRGNIIASLRRLEKVQAEVTIPDIQNIAIAEFFSKFNYFDLSDELEQTSIFEELCVFLNNLELVANDFDITEKRNGWWSELYKKKWDI